MDEILTIDSDTSESDLDIGNNKVSEPNHDSKEVLRSRKQKKNIVTLLKDFKIHLPKGSVIRARQTYVSSIKKNVNTNFSRRCRAGINGRHLPEASTKLISNKAVKEIEMLSVSSSGESDEENKDQSERRVHLQGLTRKVLDTRRDKVTNKKSLDVDLSSTSRYSLLPQKTVNAGTTLADNTKSSNPVRSSTDNVPYTNGSYLDIQFPAGLALEQTKICPVPIGTWDSTLSSPRSNAIHSAEDPGGLILIPSVLFSPISLSPAIQSSSQYPISCPSRSVTNESLLPPTTSNNQNDLVIKSSVLLDQIDSSKHAHSLNPTVCTPGSNYMLTKDNLDLPLPSSSSRQTSTARTMVSPRSNPDPSEDDSVLIFSPISLTSSSHHSSQSTTQLLGSSSVRNSTLQVHQETTPPPSKTPHNSSSRKLTVEEISLINNLNESVSLVNMEPFLSHKVDSTSSVPNLISPVSSAKISNHPSFLPPHTRSTSTQTSFANTSLVVISPISTSSRPNNITNTIEKHLPSTDVLNQSIDPFFTYEWTWSKGGKLFLSVEEVQIMLDNCVIPENLVNNFDIRDEVLMESWTISHLSLSLVIRLLKESVGKTNLLETLTVKEELERLVTSTAPNYDEVDDGDCLNGKDTIMAALGLCKIDSVPLLVEQQNKRREELRGKKSLRAGGRKKSEATSRVKKGRKRK